MEYPIEDKVVDVTDVLEVDNEDDEIDYLINKGTDNIANKEMTCDIELTKLLQSIDDTGKAYPSAADLFAERLSDSEYGKHINTASKNIPVKPRNNFMDTFDYRQKYSLAYDYEKTDDTAYAIDGIADQLNEVHDTVKSVDQQLEDLYNRSLDVGDNLDEHILQSRDLAIKVLMIETTVVEIKHRQSMILDTLNELVKRLDNL